MIIKETLRDIVKLQRQEINFNNTGVERDLLKIIDKTSSHVIILSGIRRCGKSTLLLQIMKSMPSFYYFNFEDPRAINFELQDFEKLEIIFQEEFGRCDNYFFDEIQNVPAWERYIRKLQDRGKKVYLTGSNASLLSRELGTRLTGRHLMYELFPFSFSEMLTLKKLKPSLEAFDEYCRCGGFPEFLKYNNIEMLHQLFRDIISRDIIARHQIREHRILLELGVYLVTHCGNEFSFNRLKNQFQLGSTNTAISYVSFLEDSYLIASVPRFDYSYSKQRIHAKKIYSVDSGLTRANTASFSPDRGRLLENIVLSHLKRLHEDVYYLKNETECDFLVKEQNKISAVYQVCYELNEENLSREVEGLTYAMTLTGAQKGMILTYNQQDSFDCIPVLPVWQWCLEK
jgi:predicted AAA+ superfamily ATPase